jgi:hypothetical protein
MPLAASGSGWSASDPRRPEKGIWISSGAVHADPFAVDPIRRSVILVAASAVAFFGPLVAGGPGGATAMVAGGWLGMIGLAIGLPVLALSVIETGWERLRRRLQPSIDQLDLSPRLVHILRRHGYDAIAAVERTPDPALLLLANMDARGLREVRRAIALWRYQRWQEAGFP